MASATWLDATVTVADSILTVSTPIETIEFKPSRLAWREQTEFSISGTDNNGHLRRTVLRFISNDQAQSAASTLRTLGAVEEPAPDEIPLDVRYEVSRFQKDLLAIVALVLFAPGVLFLTIAIYFPTAGILLFIAAFILLIILSRWPATLYLQRKLNLGSESQPSQTRLTQPYKAWLSQQRERLRLRTNYGNVELHPTAISWKDTVALVLTTGQSRIHLEFSTPEEATRAFQTVLQNMQQASSQYA